MLIYEALLCVFFMKSRQSSDTDVEEVSASLMCVLAWLYTHLLLDNNTVFMSNDSVC